MAGEISGIKWNDLNNNGVKDSNESGLAGWTIYLDQNKNGQLDAGEKSTTTDANGNYKFTGLTAGAYTVAEVQKPGWAQTFPTVGESTLIPIKDRRDLIFDPSRKLLYMTTSDGDVERFDINSKSLLTPFDVGNSLNGGDITSDGSALYVAENQTGATQGFIRKVNLNNGSVTNLTYNLEYDDRPSDVAIGSNGIGIVHSFGQWHPMRELNLNTDQISKRTDKTSVYGGAQIVRSVDRSLFFITQDGISSGPIFTYDAVANKFSNDKWTNAYLGNNLSAVNRNGSLIALEWGNGISILDRNLNSVENLSGVDGGMAFDPLKDVLYAANSTTDQIIAFDTNTWKELYHLDIGEDIKNDWDNSSRPFGNGMMTTSNDGQLLFMSTSSGVRMFNVTDAPAGTHKVDLSDSQVVTDINFGNHQTAPTAKLSIDNVTVTEGNSGTKDAVFTVSLDKASTQTVTVNYATANDSAIAGQDYTAKEGLLTFAPGQTKQQILVPVIGDTLVEPNETFKVNLTKATNAEIVTSVGLGTILNDDSFVLPQLSIGNVKVTEGDSGAKDATFDVSLSAASTQTVTVNYVTADESATAGQDYKQTSGILTFAPGQTTQTIAVPVIGDTLVEPDETFKVNLSNGTNATIAVASGVGTILNDDSIGGKSGNDVLIGTLGHDTLDGGAGHDTIEGLAGHDWLKGGSDHDWIDGGDGHDTVDGGSGYDTIYGGKGNDSLIGGEGDDEVYGGQNNDLLNGGDGDDIIYGGQNKDTVIGGAGDDELYGDKGNDVVIGVDSLDGAPGVGELDTLTGGEGIDRFVLGDAIAGAYYNDGKAKSSGTADFALITDFNIAEDFIQLAGTEANYVLSAIGGNTNIYLDNDGTLGLGSKDELIARVAGVTSLNLTDSYFLYV
ncbi:Calx-beta domain-containing protein [Microseira sp. BLCC-F43]|jgi:Ca2+-binding RTX toxin-like protein|uniref:Calx-beta domain-containing protein n=1 Tax=Microseira sp. BLCC-F43 TaxID=3153602 RepID=UPI0035B9D641